MDFGVMFKGLSDLVHGHFTADAITTIIYLLGASVTWILGYLKKSPASKQIEVIQSALLGAEKCINKQMYKTTGEYEQAKEDMVIQLAKMAGLKLSEDKLRAIIKGFVQKAREDANKSQEVATQ
jgi:hypothetical protein